MGCGGEMPVRESGKKSKRVILAPTSRRARDVLAPLFERRGWVVDFDPSSLDNEPVPADLVWCSGRDVPWEPVLVMQPRPPSDSFPGGTVRAMKGFARRMPTKR